MKPLLERKIELAILKEQAEIVRKFLVDDLRNYRHPSELSNNESYLQPIEQYHNMMHQKVDEYEKTQFSDLSNEVSINGYSEDVSHYDIDTALENVFDGLVRTDSESGGFYAYTSEDNVDEVSAWLKKNYPTLKFDTRVKDKTTIFVNYWDWHNLLKEHNVVVPNPIETLLSKLNEIEEMKKKIQEMGKSIFDDANEFAKTEMTLLSEEEKAKYKKIALDSVEEAYGNVTEEDDVIDKEGEIETIENYFALDIYNIDRVMELINYDVSHKSSVVLSKNIKNL